MSERQPTEEMAHKMPSATGEDDTEGNQLNRRPGTGGE